MKFLIVEPSPFSIRIPFGPKYPPQHPVFKCLSQHSSLNVRDHVSQTYSTTGNNIVLYILILKDQVRESSTWPRFMCVVKMDVDQQAELKTQVPIFLHVSIFYLKNNISY